MRDTRRRPTMSEVARLAGCSQSTVSLVLNDIPGVRIGDDTRRRVQEAARTIGYQVPWAALRAASDEAPVFAFVVDRIGTSAEAVVSIEGAREAAWSAGRTLLVVPTLSEPEIELRSIETLLARPLEGLIFASIMTRRVTPPTILRRVPTVLLNCWSKDREHPAVVPHEVAGGQAATERLIRAGHRRIGVIVGEAWMEAAQDRFKGYRKALAAAGLPFDEALVRSGDWQYGSGRAATLSLLQVTDPPTAIFCGNDRMAVGAYAALAERGMRVPDDVAIIGYDDQEMAQHLCPPLTTMLLPHHEMGQWAIDALLSGPRATGDGRFAITRLPCPLVERESVERSAASPA